MVCVFVTAVTHPSGGGFISMKTIISDLERTINTAERKKEGYMMLFLSTENAKKILQAVKIAELWERKRKTDWRDDE